MTERILPVQDPAPAVSPALANERLIVALDVPSIEQAQALVEELKGLVSFFKIGLRLHLVPGVHELIAQLLREGNRVFADFKYHDVDETVQNAVEQAANRGITFVTVHGNGSTIRAAIRGRRNKDAPKILIITVLTSLDAADMKDLGYRCSVKALVLHRAKMALEAGCDGVIASGLEAEEIRQLAQDRLLIVSPGIRLRDASTDDHKRPATPTKAIEAGADYLVVGRPIIHAPNHRHATQRILEEMQAAFEKRR